MKKVSDEELQEFISESILKPFYEKRLKKVGELELSKILKRKNPYLFKAKNIHTSEELVRYVLDAFLSSQEETIFGNLLEGLAIFVCKKVFRGEKAEAGKFKSIDLIFNREGKTYIVSIKSGVYWGNKDQIAEMKKNFKEALRILVKQGEKNEIIAVNGCMYGRDNKPFKKDPKDAQKSYYKYCGQTFWDFVTGEKQFYKRIISPIDKEAKKRDEGFKEAYSAKINEMVKEFSENYLNKEGLIDWTKLLEYVSKQN